MTFRKHKPEIHEHGFHGAVPEFHGHVGEQGLKHVAREMKDGFEVIGSNAFHNVHSHGCHHPHHQRR
jgi:hypothetical protein